MSKSYITEDDIEQDLLDKLSSKYAYNIIKCDPSVDKREELNDGTGRTKKTQCILPIILKNKLKELNKGVSDEILDSYFNSLSQNIGNADLVEKNYNIYKSIRESKTINFSYKGKEDFTQITLIDFNDVSKNDITVVSQMWVQGNYGQWRRPDVLIFVNGMPLVFIELKNATVKIKQAYEKNLKSYINDVPNLFVFNQICVLSNGIETRLGAFNTTYDYFFEWLRLNEKDKVDRNKIYNEGTSIEYLINGLLGRENLLDYIENFILFERKTTKVLDKNHQFLGVNNLYKNILNRDKLNGKLGVFWHTQGSGKSFSMVMLARKVRRKIEGNFTFLIVTDRDDLDGQIYKNFVRTEVIGDKEEVQPKNSEKLREFLKSNKNFIFTLIHKFRPEKKGERYPVLSERNDIIVLVDEAHRTQYKDLAENMRIGLPNANFVAFTGTPLLGSKRLTNQWFGDYVSEYNFSQSVEDGSTVPIFYSRRVPEAWLHNDFLDDDVVEIVENENLTDSEQKILENSSSRILEVIKRDDRLEKVARDIAHHLPHRGYLGKAMVVSVDKFTTVKMYNKVKYCIEEEKKKYIDLRNSFKNEDLSNPRIKEAFDDTCKGLNYLNNIDMAVIISEDADEIEKFKKQGLEISIHRDKMNEIVDGIDIEDKFKDPNDKLSLVFVCAMWLTGFDVKNLSTLYLDKPMKSHTLMQAIARVNRVYEGKMMGEVIDYVNIFKYMEKALGDYGGENTGGEYPAKDIEELLNLLDESIVEIEKLLKGIGIDFDKMTKEYITLNKLDLVYDAYNKIIDKSDVKDKFKVMANTLENIYEASKPEVFELEWDNYSVYSPIIYINGLINNSIRDEKIENAKRRMGELLDRSVKSNDANSDTDFVIHQGKVIDLSKIDIEEIRKTIKTSKYKCIEIDNLKEYISKILAQMINKNVNRVKFSERFKSIIDSYNAGGTENEDYYEKLLKLMEDLKKENVRSDDLGLTEEELEIYDLLIKGKKLTNAEEKAVILSAKNLYLKLMQDKQDLFVVDWYKDEQPKARVLSAIENILNEDLPESYDKEVFKSKSMLLLDHFIDMTVQGYGWLGKAA